MPKPIAEQYQGRKADEVVAQTSRKLGVFRLIASKNITLWKAALWVVFLGVFVGALAFIAGTDVSDSYEQPTDASVTSDMTFQLFRPYVNNFDSAASISQWVSYGDKKGSWQVKEPGAGILERQSRLFSPANNKIHAIVGNDTPQASNFSAAFTIRIPKESKKAQGGLLFHTQNSGSGFLLRFEPKDQQWKLATVKPSGSDSKVTSGKLKLAYNTDYSVRLELLENKLSFTIAPNGGDNVQPVVVRDIQLPRLFPAGRFGFWADEGQVQFDDLMVKYIEPTTKPDLTVVGIIVGGNPVPRGFVDLSVTYKNIGTRAVTKDFNAGVDFGQFSEMFLFKDDNAIPDTSGPYPSGLDPLEPGEIFGETYHGYFTQTGAITLKAEVDPQERIPELDESNNLYKLEIVVTEAGNVSLTNASSNPSEHLAAGGSSGNVLQVFSALANLEDVEVREMGFGFASTNSKPGSDPFGALDTIYLYDGPTLLGSAPVVGSHATISPSGLLLRAGFSKELTMKVDTNSVGGPNDAGSSGVNLSSLVSNVHGVGIASGSIASSNGEPFSSQMTVVKSIPTVNVITMAPTVLQNGSGVPLGRVSVAADPKGDVALYELSYLISHKGAAVSNVKLYEDPDTASLNLTIDGGRSPVSSTDAQSEYRILFDTTGDGVLNGGEYRVIPAGGYRIYELRGDVSGSSSGSMVSVKLLGDDQFPSVYPNCAGGASSGNNRCGGIFSDQMSHGFVWSDLHFGNSSSTATNTKEWFNGYLVPGLSSQGLLLKTLSR